VAQSFNDDDADHSFLSFAAVSLKNYQFFSFLWTCSVSTSAQRGRQGISETIDIIETTVRH
jgi:hypothetical protein